MPDLQHQLDQKTAQLAALREIGRANGVLMRREGLSEEEAYLRIQRQARKERRTKRQVAEAILLHASGLI